MIINSLKRESKRINIYKNDNIINIVQNDWMK